MENYEKIKSFDIHLWHKTTFLGFIFLFLKIKLNVRGLKNGKTTELFIPNQRSTEENDLLSKKQSRRDMYK